MADASSKYEITVHGYVVDRELAPYVNEYLSDLVTRGLLPTGTNPLFYVTCELYSRENAGVTHYEFGYSWIEIDCKNHAPAMNRLLVYHEMTHALFDLVHSKCENEIQYWRVPDLDVLLRADWSAMVERLMIFIKTRGAIDVCH